MLTGNIFEDLGAAFLRLIIGSPVANASSEESSWDNCVRRLSRRVNLVSLFVVWVTFTAEDENNLRGTWWYSSWHAARINGAIARRVGMCRAAIVRMNSSAISMVQWSMMAWGGFWGVYSPKVYRVTFFSRSGTRACLRYCTCKNELIIKHKQRS